MSTKLNKAILKVAQQNPEFAKALTAELSKTAGVGDEVDRAVQKLVQTVKSKDPSKLDARSLEANSDGEILAQILAPVLQGAAMRLKDPRGFFKALKKHL